MNVITYMNFAFFSACIGPITSVSPVWSSSHYDRFPGVRDLVLFYSRQGSHCTSGVDMFI